MSEPRPYAELFDKRVAELDGRFKRAALGSGCYNCGCPAQYIRHGNEAEAVTAYLASPEAEERLAQALTEMSEPDGPGIRAEARAILAEWRKP